MSKFRLFSLLGSRQDYPVCFLDSKKIAHMGYLQSVQKEDGSGNSFNVTIYNSSTCQIDTFHMSVEP